MLSSGAFSLIPPILMSKFEVLQNGKIMKETEYISKALDYNVFLN